MSDILDRVAAIAPRVPVDPEGLASARDLSRRRDDRTRQQRPR